MMKILTLVKTKRARLLASPHNRVNITCVGAVHCALRPRGGGLRGGGGRGDHGAQAHRQAILHLQVGARVEI